MPPPKKKNNDHTIIYFTVNRPQWEEGLTMSSVTPRGWLSPYSTLLYSTLLSLRCRQCHCALSSHQGPPASCWTRIRRNTYSRAALASLRVLIPGPLMMQRALCTVYYREKAGSRDLSHLTSLFFFFVFFLMNK